MPTDSSRKLQSGPEEVQFLLMTPKSSKATAPTSVVPSQTSGPVTLSIDIGGSGLKAMLLDSAGKPVSERQRVVTTGRPKAMASTATNPKLSAP